MENRGTGRRTLLQRGLALLAGGAAFVVGARSSRVEAATPADTGHRAEGSLTLYARKRPLGIRPAGGHRGHGADGRQLASGELLDTPGGARIGEFFTNCFCLDSPFGPQAAASNLEFQVLQLKDGTLFGLSAGSAGPDNTKVHALVGGTGRYAGARGSYYEKAAATSGPHDLVELVVTLAN